MIQRVHGSEQKPQRQKEIKESTSYSKRQKKISNSRTIRKQPKYHKEQWDPSHFTNKIYCKLDYKFGYTEQSKFSYIFTNLYASNSRKNSSD